MVATQKVDRHHWQRNSKIDSCRISVFCRRIRNRHGLCARHRRREEISARFRKGKSLQPSFSDLFSKSLPACWNWMPMSGCGPETKLRIFCRRRDPSFSIAGRPSIGLHSSMVANTISSLSSREIHASSLWRCILGWSIDCGFLCVETFDEMKSSQGLVPIDFDIRFWG